ncbi:MAG: hypothetical protein H0U49_10555 [Parachlamydiaceae bacterium]|nr:hypothetical protein [Parachlamydiaceae bacterium]
MDSSFFTPKCSPLFQLVTSGKSVCMAFTLVNSASEFKLRIGQVIFNLDVLTKALKHVAWHSNAEFGRWVLSVLAERVTTIKARLHGL